MRSRGPRMGKRPQDFDEELVKQAPTFKKWLELEVGESLRYACRYFTKGNGDDEERLMRRIMIARRNNVKEHKMLKTARSAMKDRIQEIQKRKISSQSTTTATTTTSTKENAALVKTNDLSTITKRKRALIENCAGPAVMSDLEVMEEMDVEAVENTPSFQTWRGLMDGIPFTYSQTFIKGKAGHEWLLKKSIWRKMRYRRENKRLVTEMQKQKQAEKLTRTVPFAKNTTKSSTPNKNDCDLKKSAIDVTVENHQGIKNENHTGDDGHLVKKKVRTPIQNNKLLKDDKLNSSKCIEDIESPKINVESYTQEISDHHKKMNTLIKNEVSHIKDNVTISKIPGIVLLYDEIESNTVCQQSKDIAPDNTSFKDKKEEI